MKYIVRFSVTYETEIDCKPDELVDMISNLNIPEDDQTKYVADSFEVISKHPKMYEHIVKEVK